MFRFTSNMDAVFLDLARDIALAERNFSVNLRRAGLDAVAVISFRIQQQGEGVNGQRLETKSPTRNGAYSAAHAKERAGRGRQVVQVDFTLDGDLMRSFTVLNVSDTLMEVGFQSDRQADIAEYLETYFGDAFGLSSSEGDVIIDGLVDRLLDDLRG